jgi:hypothetical protein
MRRTLLACALLGCGSQRSLGDGYAPEPAPSAIEKLNTEFAELPLPHGPDLPYLRAGCGPLVATPEHEPSEPPVDPKSDFASLYVRPSSLADVGELRTPPRGTLAYLRERAIWIAAADGTARQRLVQAPWNKNETHGAPQWAFDGRELLFVTTQGEPRGRIVRFDRRCGYAAVIGPAVCELGATCVDPENTQLIVSPDGTRVLFAIQQGQRSALAMLDLLRGTTRLVAADHQPPAAWSRDGSRIAYRMPETDAVIVVDLPSGTRDVVSHHSRAHSNPVFGEDNNTLWFTTTTKFADFVFDVSVARAAVPTDLRTHTPAPPYALGALIARTDRLWHMSAVRSPDAKWIAVRVVEGLPGLANQFLEVHATTPIAKSFALGVGRSTPHHYAYGPTFSPDSELVAYTLSYCANIGCTRGTSLVAVSDGAVEAFVATGSLPAWTGAEGL